MKRCLALGLVVSLVAASVARAAAPPPAPAKSKTFTSRAGGFEMKVPSEPTEETRDLGEVTLTVFSGQLQGDLGYTVVHCDIPEGAPELADPEELFDEVVKGAAGPTKGKVVREKKTKLGGHPGREAWIQTGDGKGGVRLRVILAKDRLYVVGVNCPAGKKVDGAEATAFLDSFKVKVEH